MDPMCYSNNDMTSSYCEKCFWQFISLADKITLKPAPASDKTYMQLMQFNCTKVFQVSNFSVRFFNIENVDFAVPKYRFL